MTMNMETHLNRAPKGEDKLLALATDIVSGFVSFNPHPASKLSLLLENVHTTLQDIANTEELKATTQKPAVDISDSVFEEYIVCLEDGEKLKMLKRHLRSRYGLTPEQYRLKWGLPKDYPMVAPGYATKRSKLAKQIGLGKKN